MKRRSVILVALFVVMSLTGCNSMNLQQRFATILEPLTKQSSQPQVTVASENSLAVSIGSRPEKQHYTHLLNIGFDGLKPDEIGYYMDIQEARLRQEFANEDILIKRQKDDIRLVIPGQVMFAKNSVTINPNAIRSLDSIAQILSEYNKTLVAVEGYTDNTGVPEYNQRLSEQRALTAGNYLAKKGIVVERLIIVGHGEKHPLVNNSTEQGRAQNRRVELTLYPLMRLDYSQAQL